MASCSGGSVATTPVATPTPAPTTTTQTVPTGGGTLALPVAPNGQTASIAVAPGAPAGVSITATSSNTAPSSAPAPSSVKRVQSITGAVPFLFVTFTVSANLSAQYLNVSQVSLIPSDPATASYYVEFDDLSTTPVTKLGTEGPATLTAGFANFPTTTGTGGGANSPTLTAGHTYLIQFYYVPGSATSSPSASPTATATATATAMASASASPSASPSASASASASPSPSPSSSASATPIPTFTFTNAGVDTTSCTTMTCSVPLVVSDGAINWEALFNSPSVNTSITGNIALSTSQISPSTGFPVFTGTGTVELYFQLSATPAVTFPMTPAIQVSGLTGGVTSCIFYGYTSGNSNVNSWSAISPATGAAMVTGGAATMPAVSVGGVINITPTPFYGAVVCT